jgi:hypothetical protein
MILSINKWDPKGTTKGERKMTGWTSKSTYESNLGEIKVKTLN